MNYAWIAIILAQFLPNLGLQRQTPVGLLTMQDYVLPFGLVVAWRAARPYVAAGQRTTDAVLWTCCGLLLVLAVLSTLSIPIRFLYRDTTVLFYSLGKCAKLFAYGGLGYLLAVRAGTREGRNDLAIAAAAASFLALATFLFGQFVLHVGLPRASKSWVAVPNQYSIQLALLAPALMGNAFRATASARERRWALIALAAGLVASLISRGRAGFVLYAIVAVVGSVRLGAGRALLAGVLVAGSVAAATAVSPVARRELTSLLVTHISYNLDAEDESEMDDGGRLVTLAHEWPRLKEQPIWGWGFYHRGRRSPLMWTGSHNFWMQIQLELGVLGSLLSLAILIRMAWLGLRLPSSLGFDRLTTLLGAAVIFGAGMTGEYYYGTSCLTLGLLAHTPGVVAWVELQRAGARAVQPRPSGVPAARRVAA